MGNLLWIVLARRENIKYGGIVDGRCTDENEVSLLLLRSEVTVPEESGQEGGDYIQTDCPKDG